MKVFVVNCGSSSIKFQLFDMIDETVIVRGQMERVGTDEATLHITSDGMDFPPDVVGKTGGENHKTGLKTILDAMINRGVIAAVSEIEGVGHRVVHGGREMSGSHVIDDEVLSVIKRNCELAPLHNPPNLAGIEAAMEEIPHAPHVAVFDTAFLATLPPKAHRYAIPNEWYETHHVRKYGFHGTSHRWVTHRTARLLKKDVSDVNLITVHLGNGCSITAVAGGKAVDHSMGLTPLEGLVMGTRCGDLDPAVVLYMASKGMSVQDIDTALNKQSGLLGVSGRSNDMRDLLEAVATGDKKAALAVELFVYRIVKYIGSYYTILPALDAVVLTGGIGENSLPIREGVCRGIARLGAKFDAARNDATVKGKIGPITTDDSELPVLIVPTNEELMIARDTKTVVAQAN